MPCLLHPSTCWWTFSLFLVWAIVNSAAMNIGVVDLCSRVLSRYMLSSELTGSHELLFLAFWGTSVLFPKVAGQFTFPPAVQARPLFSVAPPAFTVCSLFGRGHSDGCEVTCVSVQCSFTSVCPCVRAAQIEIQDVSKQLPPVLPSTVLST